jgi:hypothetical protein
VLACAVTLGGLLVGMEAPVKSTLGAAVWHRVLLVNNHV